ncbi:MAG: hypothetical protein COV66_15240 [Nitrospinae bacterium CG11_big_fil_rev_8_21_14_0_20_45_15]|nr:MAG: hypothetical protein COV66_15240 [Nitrospinae bacterium CG11_big_fil_rev_8_21_14_0_20_45_15]
MIKTPPIFSILCGLVFMTIASPQFSLAHSGHKKEAPVVMEPEATDPTDSIYTIDKPDHAESLSLPGAKDLFGREDMIMPDMPGMTGMSHEGHEAMPKVVHAKREWNSSDRSGYGVAWGMTLLSAGLFAFLVRKPSGK